jgi:hypothetical protein
VQISRSAWGTLCLAALLFGAAASAQLRLNQADRPGVSTPPVVIPKGTLQVEVGVELERDTGGAGPDTDTLTAPDLLLRVSVAESVELRLQLDGLEYQFRDGASDRALASDFGIATKAELFPQRGLRPFTGLLVALSFPVGSKAITSNGFDPELAGLFQWDLGERTELVFNTVFAVPTQGSGDDRRIFQFEPRLSLDRMITRNIGAFVEYYGEIKAGGEADTHSLDGGISWRVEDRRIQLDLSGGGGLVEAAPDWFISAGVSMRFQAPWAP